VRFNLEIKGYVDFHSGIKGYNECNRLRTVGFLLTTYSIFLYCTNFVGNNLHFGENTQQVRLYRRAETQADLYVNGSLYAPDLNKLYLQFPRYMYDLTQICETDLGLFLV
jgi:hypothetical protein